MDDLFLNRAHEALSVRVQIRRSSAVTVCSRYLRSNNPRKACELLGISIDDEITFAEQEPIDDVGQVAADLQNEQLVRIVVMPAMCTERVAISMKKST